MGVYPLKANILGLGILLASTALAAAPAEGSIGGPAGHAQQAIDGVASSSIYIESTDGTRLAITVHRPAHNGAAIETALPVIVTQDRSGGSPGQLETMRRYIDAGYVWVAQDRRGTGASFGVQTGFVNQLDAMDAKAVIDWSAQQEFSSGASVALGCSNQGAWQYLVAAMQPESLVAIAPACSSPQFFDDAVKMNGVPLIALADRPYEGECNRPPSGARPAGFVPPPPAPVDADKDGSLLAAAQAEQRCGAPMLGQYWLDMPRDGMNVFAGYRPGMDDTAMTNWQAVRDSGVKVLQMGGWFDAAVAGQIAGYRAWGGELVMGPWVHGNRLPRGADLPNAELDLAAITLAFFDRHAKGIAPRTAPSPIRYYTVNAPAGSEWTHTDSWPSLPRRALYLHAGVMLGWTPADTPSARSLGPGGAQWFEGTYAPLSRWWSGSFAATNAGSLLYTSAALARDSEITGAVTADMWITANRPDVNLFAMLQDVAPDGSATYITDGRLRASWRATHKPDWPGATRTWHRGFAQDIAQLEEGEPARLTFDFFPASYIVPQGHRLRLALTTSIGADYQAPPLAGGQPSTITVLEGAEHPSLLSVPLAER